MSLSKIERCEFSTSTELLSAMHFAAIVARRVVLWDVAYIALKTSFRVASDSRRRGPVARLRRAECGLSGMAVPCATLCCKADCIRAKGEYGAKSTLYKSALLPIINGAL